MARIVSPSEFQLVPDVSPLAQTLARAIGQRAERNRLNEAQEAKAKAEKLKRDFQTTGAQFLRIRDIPDFATKRAEIGRLGQAAIANGEDYRLFEEALDINNPDELNLFLTRTATAAGNAEQLIAKGLERDFGVKKPSEGLASAKTEIFDTGASIQALPSGVVEVRNPLGEVVEGEERLRILDEAGKEKSRKARESADLSVQTEQRKAEVKARQSRISDIRKEYSTRNRESSRSEVRLNRALKLADKASQGLTGAIKVQFAKLFPNIDVTDETALNQSLLSLSLDELQKFKGPTTDFEFGIAQSAVGALSDPKTANIARIKGIMRNNWFNKKEVEQFNKHVRGGGDPETFAFDFKEKIETKKGAYTLEDLQNTAVEKNMTIDEVLKRLNNG